MDPSIPFLACLLGAVAMFLMLRPGPKPLRAAGGVLGLLVFAWLLVQGLSHLAPDGARGAPELFFIVFSLIAAGCAVRMITHHRPVYSALYFVMVVLSSAALFLLLEAEFMAFALVIVYAGAILVTYMFVLMLAQQAPQADSPSSQPDYDVVAREPAAASVVCFIMLWLLTSMIFDGVGGVAPQPPQADTSHEILAKLPAGQQPDNVQLVGLDLVARFPVSLELAGVILLMAMFGAVVLARKQIELGEDETREAAGLSRLDLHADDPNTAARLMGGTGLSHRGGREVRP